MNVNSEETKVESIEEINIVKIESIEEDKFNSSCELCDCFICNKSCTNCETCNGGIKDNKHIICNENWIENCANCSVKETKKVESVEEIKNNGEEKKSLPISLVEKKETKVFPKHTGIVNNKFFENILLLTQKSLKGYLVSQLKSLGYDPICEDGFCYARGEIPVLLTAHMDTVHAFCPYIIVEETTPLGLNKVWSPYGIGGDDRCGVYMILQIIKEYKCSVLFCEDEESGGIGSSKFCKTKYISELEKMQYMIELDRANESDAVFYDCDNDDFVTFIEKNIGYKKTWGTFSDISNLCPKAKVAGVNLSCGYYKAHTTNEYIILQEVEMTIYSVTYLLSITTKEDKFIYVEKKYNYGKLYNRRNYYDDGSFYDDYDYTGYIKDCKSTNLSEKSNLEDIILGTEKQKLDDKELDEGLDDDEDKYYNIDVDSDDMFFEDVDYYEFTYVDFYNVRRTGYGSGVTTQSAVGDFLIKNPLVNFSQIVSYVEY